MEADTFRAGILGPRVTGIFGETGAGAPANAASKSAMREDFDVGFRLLDITAWGASPFGGGVTARRFLGGCSDSV